MKKIIIAMFAFATIPTSAQAEDALFNWSGGYLGAHAGYFAAKPHYMEPNYPNYSRNPKLDSFNGGALAGYNTQTKGLVLGVEADIGLTNANKGADVSATYNDYTAFDFDWNAHIRARAGVPLGASERTLLFVAGGAAIAKFTVDDTDPGWDQSSQTHWGWTLGGGVEHAISNNVVLRLEYLYDDYGSKSHVFTDGFEPYTGHWHPKASTVRGAVAVHI